MLEADGASSDDDEDTYKLVQGVQAARTSLANGFNRQALAQLLNLIVEFPALSEVLEAEVVSAVTMCTDELMLKTKFEDACSQASFLFKGVQKAMPLSASLVCAEGKFYHKYADQSKESRLVVGVPIEKAASMGRVTGAINGHLTAIRCFRRALMIDPNHAEAAENLESLYSFGVERWHFRMLNDYERNNCYNQALVNCLSRLKNIRQNNEVSVLDIGSGTGILSLMAARAGADKVYGCETNSVLYEISNETAMKPDHVGFHQKVEFFNKHSSELQISNSQITTSSSSLSSMSSSHLPEKVDLVVTELVDSGLVGEHMLQVLRHAAKELLKPNGSMIPNAASLFAFPINCPSIRPRQRILYDFEITKSNLILRIKNKNMNDNERKKTSNSFYGITCNTLSIKLDEAYTCESLSYFPHLKLTQEPIHAINLNFHSISKQPEAQEVIQDSLFQTLNFNTQPKVQEEEDDDDEHDVVVDAIAVYFTLILDSGEPDIDCPKDKTRDHELDRLAFDTHPDRIGSGWDQGIYPLVCGLSELKTTSSYKLRTRLNEDDSLSFEILSNNSDNDDNEIQPVSMMEKMILKQPIEEYKIGEMDMAAMNNRDWHGLFLEAIELHMSHHKTVSIFELCGSFSVLSLACIAVNKDSNQRASWNRVKCNVRSTNSTHHSILRCLINENNLNDDVNVFGPEDAISVYLSSSENSQNIETNNNNEMIILDLIEGCGLIRQGALEELSALFLYLKYQFSHHQHHALHTTTYPTVIPSFLEIVIVPLECHWLLEQNSVKREACMGLDLSAINEFGVRLFRELPLSCLPHQFLSNPIALPEKLNLQFHHFLECNQMKIDEQSDNDADQKGNCESFGDHFTVYSQKPLKFTIHKAGTIHGFAFWFNQILSQNIDEVRNNLEMSTGPLINPLSHWRQAAVAVNPPLKVVPNQIVSVDVKMGLGINAGIEIKTVS